MPAVGIVAKPVVVVAPETLHGDLRELGGGPHLVGITGDEEDGSSGTLDLYPRARRTRAASSVASPQVVSRPPQADADTPDAATRKKPRRVYSRRG